MSSTNEFDIVASGIFKVTTKQVEKSPKDESYSSVILGVNQDFTDDVTEEEQEMLITKHSIPEVPNKDNYYTFKINGKYYVKQSPTLFSLYEKVVIRVPNGSWNNMYIEVQRDTISEPVISGGSSWITSVNEPDDNTDGNYWVRIDDEDTRNAIEIRKYDIDNGNWNNLDYWVGSFKPITDINGRNISSVELISNKRCSYGTVTNQSIIIGNQNCSINYPADTLDDSVIGCYFPNSMIEMKSVSGGYDLKIKTNFFSLGIVEDTQYYLIYDDIYCNDVTVTPSWEGTFNHPLSLLCPFTTEDLDDNGYLNLKGISINNYISSSVLSYMSPNGWRIQKNKKGTSAIYSLVIGTNNKISQGVIVGSYNKGHKNGSLILGSENTDCKVSVGSKNYYCTYNLGDNNINTFCSVGNFNNVPDGTYQNSAGQTVKQKICNAYMLGNNLQAYVPYGGIYMNGSSPDNRPRYFWGIYNDCYAGGNGTSNYVDIFGWGNGYLAGSRNIRTLDVDGNQWIAGAYSSGGGDYSEEYEWIDENPNNEDRRGLFVTLKGRKLVLATKDDNYILGVMSANPSIKGNSADSEWFWKYKRDIFETHIKDENGNLILSEEFDPNKKYIPRNMRSEYDYIGTHGQLIVVDDGTCEVDGYCCAGENGVGTRCDDMEKEYRKLAFRVTERLDETHVRIVIK